MYFEIPMEKYLTAPAPTVRKISSIKDIIPCYGDYSSAFRGCSREVRAGHRP